MKTIIFTTDRRKIYVCENSKIIRTYIIFDGFVCVNPNFNSTEMFKTNINVSGKDVDITDLKKYDDIFYGGVF